jgi:hypothetical protein
MGCALFRIRSRIPLKVFCWKFRTKASSSAYDQKRDKLWSILSGLSPKRCHVEIRLNVDKVSRKHFALELYIMLSSQRHLWLFESRAIVPSIRDQRHLLDLHGFLSCTLHNFVQVTPFVLVSITSPRSRSIDSRMLDLFLVYRFLRLSIAMLRLLPIPVHFPV